MAIMVSKMRPKRAVRPAPESGKKNKDHFGRGYPKWTVKQRIAFRVLID
jgi:hypothetical protein